MKKTILASAIGLATISAFTSTQVLADDYYFRYPVSSSINDTSGGGNNSGEGNGGDGIECNEGYIEQEDECVKEEESENLSIWEQYGENLEKKTYDKVFNYDDFNSISWNAGDNGYRLNAFGKLIRKLPSEGYPEKNPDKIDLRGFKINDIGGISSIDSVGILYINNSENTGMVNRDFLYDFSNFTFEVRDEININSFAVLTTDERFKPIPKDAFLCEFGREDLFTGQSQEQLCESITIPPWPKFAEENDLYYDKWESTAWVSETLNSIPIAPYPTTTPTGALNFSINSIKNIEGFKNITQVGGDFNVRFNDIVSVEPLSKLTKVGGDFDISYNNISKINALSKLSKVGGDFNISDNGIKNINSLSNLIVDGNIMIPKSYSGDRLGMDTVFCKNNKEEQFNTYDNEGIADKQDVCKEESVITIGGAQVVDRSRMYNKNRIEFEISTSNVALDKPVELEITTAGNTQNDTIYLEEGSYETPLLIGYDISSVYTYFNPIEIKVSVENLDGDTITDTLKVQEDVRFGHYNTGGDITVTDGGLGYDSSFDEGEHEGRTLTGVIHMFRNLDTTEPINFTITSNDSNNTVTGHIILNADGSVKSVNEGKLIVRDFDTHNISDTNVPTINFNITDLFKDSSEEFPNIDLKLEAIDVDGNIVKSQKYNTFW